MVQIIVLLQLSLCLSSCSEIAPFNDLYLYKLNRIYISELFMAFSPHFQELVQVIVYPKFKRK